MKVINHLEQGSSAWVSWRRGKIGASESASALGMSPYTTKRKLWEEKTGRAEGFKGNELSRLGQEMEPIIRDAYEKQYGGFYTTPTAEHSEYSFISASLDGYSTSWNGRIIEIKYSKYPKMVNVFKTGSVDELKKEYLQYWVQCQHQMFVSDTSDCHIVTMDNDGIIYRIKVTRDDKFIDEVLLPGLIEFWEYIKTDTPPEGDCLVIDNTEAVLKAVELVGIDARIKALTERKKELAEQLTDLGDEESLEIKGILKFSRVSRKGSINAKKLYEDYNISDIEVEKYRNDSVRYFKMTKI